MTESPASPKKAKMDNMDFHELSKEDLINIVKDQERTIRQLEDRLKSGKGTGDENKDIKELEAKLKQHQRDAARRENTLVHRLTTKEQELQDYVNQIQEFKQSQTQNKAQLQTMLLDPAVNLVFQRMTKEMEESQEKLKQTQNELSAWKFTPDSQTGKRLMAKCRMLLQENEELGKVITSGRTAKLEGEIAVQKQLVEEMKGNQSELDEFLGDLEEDVEGMQSMIYVLQQQLKDTKDQVTKLEEENSQLKSSNQTLQHSPCKTHSVHTPKVSHSSFSTSPSRDSHITPVKQEPEIDTPIHVKQEVMCERTSTTHITEHDHEIEGKFHPQTNCEEMMETDQDSKEINHVSYSTSQKLHPTSDPRLHPSSDRTKYTDYRDDSSQDGWSTPTHDTKDDFNGENKQTDAMDSTPEMDRPSDKGFPVGGDLIPNGVNRTPAEEIGEA